MAKLIARFYDPASGAVRVDGVDLREVELGSFRRQLGVVLQDPFLFSGTIADNIRFANPEATDAQVEATAAAIGVDRVAARFDEGLQRGTERELLAVEGPFRRLAHELRGTEQAA